MSIMREVPQGDIDRLEQARKDLWKLISTNCPALQPTIINITGVMFTITHRNYTEKKRRYNILEQSRKCIRFLRQFLLSMLSPRRRQRERTR